jgi:hypothetical protein
MTPQQYKAYIRKINAANKKAVDDYNRKVNAANKKSVDNYNREVKKVNDHNKKVYTERKSAIQKYNRDVDKFNAEQRRRKQSYDSAIRILNSTPQSKIIQYSTRSISQSSIELSDTFTSLRNDPVIKSHQTSKKLITAWPERETANSLDLTNALNGHYIDVASVDFLKKSEIEESLDSLSSELGNRWKGALFSLNHNNPDASRHFCSSVREILIKVIDTKAPDKDVFQLFPNCSLHGNSPNRRTKIEYILSNNSLNVTSLVDFIDRDVNDVLNLFYELNSGTHGDAGKFNANQLIQLKKRVEDSIQYMLTF